MEGLARCAPLGLHAAALSGCAALPFEGATPAPQPPTFSNDTATTAKETVELESGITFDPRDPFDSHFTARVVVSEASEVFAGWPLWRCVGTSGTDGRGQGDLHLGVQERFLDETEVAPSAAFQFATKITAASEREGLGSGEVDFFGSARATKSFGSATATAFYHLGLLGESGGGDSDVEHGLAFAASVPIERALAAFGKLADVYEPVAAPDFHFVFGTTIHFGGPLRRR